MFTIPHSKGFWLLAVLVVLEIAAAADPFRAIYQFGSTHAYSAIADLPQYRVVDLGSGIHPIAVNDQGTVLLWEEGNRLVRWSCGQSDLLWQDFTDTSVAFLNENGLVAAFPYQSDGDMELVAWWPDSAVPLVFPWDPNVLDALTAVNLYSLNDKNELILQIESLSNGFPIPPASCQRITSSVFMEASTWETLSRYDWTMNMDFSMNQGGAIYEVADSNSFGDTVGWLYSNSAYTPPMGNAPIFAYQDEFYAYNQQIQLGFEPLQINDARTILGRSPAPLPGLIIVDNSGQRQLGPVIDNLDSLDPLMSNPRDGLEEILIGNLYLKRKVECNFSGNPTGLPSPDFYFGTLDEIVVDASSWQDLQGTCISANGRIAGTGMRVNPSTGALEEHAFLLLPGAVIPDWNRDGCIDKADQKLASKGKPWRFWVNDDDDTGDLARSCMDDLPGSSEPDCQQTGVDGLRDVVDFFPVLLDLKSLLSTVPDTDQISITLSHKDAALNFVYTNLRPDEVGNLHSMKMPEGFGPDFSMPPGSAPTHPIGPDPVRLSDRFIHNIRSENRGVLLFECTRESHAPLSVKVSRNGIEVITFSLQLSISPVQDMFRVINLRRADPKFSISDPGPWPTDTGEPPNLPDSFFLEILEPIRTLVHIHGFNWDGQEIPAAHAEVFKRFFQSGSNARFIGVSWFGNQGKLELLDTTFDYNENVVNAFITARYAAEALEPFSGSFTSLFAHSLGNMVASSSVLDFGLTVGCYFMINAAVPNEAYLGEQDNRRLMVHPDWKDWEGPSPDYDEFLLSSNWFRLFPDSDKRSVLKWKNRFDGIKDLAICLNFYSTGEEILASGNGDIPSLFEKVWNRELIWTYNEMLKGTTQLTSTLLGETQGGWGFNQYHMDWMNPGGAAHPPSGYWEKLPPEEASLISPEICIKHPFFRCFSTSDAQYPSWGSGDWLYEDAASANNYLPTEPYASAPMDLFKNHARILAGAIPAHCFPTGSTPLPIVQLFQNYNMDALFRDPDHWPHRAEPEKRNRWLHSDYLNPSLSQVNGLYSACIHNINYIP